VIVAEANKLGYKLTPRDVAEGVATVQIESSGNTSNFVQGAGGHIGGLSESPAFGSVAERLNPGAAVRAGLENWHSEGGWWNAWGQWEKEQAGRWGGEPSEYKQYLGIAEAALGHPASIGARQVSRRPGGEASPATSGASSLGGDLMHAGLVGVLVLGGAGLLAFGGSRFVGASKAGKVLGE